MGRCYFSKIDHSARRCVSGGYVAKECNCAQLPVSIHMLDVAGFARASFAQVTIAIFKPKSNPVSPFYAEPTKPTAARSKPAVGAMCHTVASLRRYVPLRLSGCNAYPLCAQHRHRMLGLARAPEDLSRQSAGI